MHAPDPRIPARRRRASPPAGLIVAILAIAGAVVAPPIPQPASAAADSAPVVFILDASGSMEREVSPGVSRMDVAKEAAIDTLDSLPDGTDVGLLVFGTGTGNTDAEKAAGCSDVTTLAPLGRLDVDALSRKVRGVTQSGFTPIGPALRQAASMLPTDRPGDIVLVSDGVDTCSPPSSCEVASQVHRDNPHISIHVVAFGVDDDEAAQQQMTCIGGVGGGTAVTATNPGQLAARLKAASNSAASTLLLGVRGSHGVELGMSLDEVRAQADGAKVGSPRTVDGVVVILVDCGWGTVELHDDRVYSITPKEKSTGTAEGISKGDTLAAAEELYGAPVDAGTSADGAFSVYQAQTGSPVGYRVFYDAQSKKIRYIVVCRCVPASVLSGSMADWEISFDGVGPLRLGMSIAEATAAVPQLVQGYADYAYSIPGTGPVDTMSLTFLQGSLAEIRIATPWGEVPNGAQLPHARGIRFGELAGTVQNAFPGGSYQSYLVAGSSNYLVANREGRLLTFSVDGASMGSENSIAEQVASQPLTGITLEDAAAMRTKAAYAFLYGG